MSRVFLFIANPENASDGAAFSKKLLFDNGSVWEWEISLIFLTPKKGKTFYVLVLGALQSSSLWAARCCRNNNSIAGNTIMNTATWNYYAHHHLNDTNLDFPIDYKSVGAQLVLGFFRRHRASEVNTRYNVITFCSNLYRRFREMFKKWRLGGREGGQYPDGRRFPSHSRKIFFFRSIFTQWRYVW